MGVEYFFNEEFVERTMYNIMWRKSYPKLMRYQYRLRYDNSEIKTLLCRTLKEKT